MKWNKPQSFINNSLFYLGLLSFLGALLWLSIFYIWNNHPNLVDEYDKSMPDKYTDKISRLYTRTFKGKSPEDTVKRHRIFTKALNGITQLHKFYDKYTDSQIFLIDYLLTQNRLAEAEEQANIWQKNYPYDFNTKFKYADVLYKINIDKALDYYVEVYRKHKDIFKLNQRYVSLLLENGQFNKALKIAEYSKTKNRKQNHLKFSFYYADNSNKKYSAKTKSLVNSQTSIGNGYILKLSLKLNGLTKLRFDIDRLIIGSKLTDISFNIKTQTQTYKNIKAFPLHHLEIINDQLTSTGMDPYLQLNLPEALIGIKEEIQIEASINIEKKKTLVLDTITHHKGWQFSCSLGDDVTFINSNHFFLTQNNKNKQYSSTTKIQQSCDYIKINFPFLKNLSFNNLNIKINDAILSQNNIYSLNGINKVSENSFIIETERPFIIYKVEKRLKPGSMTINISLGGPE